MSMQTQRGCRAAGGSGGPVAARAVVADMSEKDQVDRTHVSKSLNLCKECERLGG
jgi:hypothetical protein